MFRSIFRAFSYCLEKLRKAWGWLSKEVTEEQAQLASYSFIGAGIILAKPLGFAFAAPMLTIGICLVFLGRSSAEVRVSMCADMISEKFKVKKMFNLLEDDVVDVEYVDEI